MNGGNAVTSCAHRSLGRLSCQLRSQHDAQTFRMLASHFMTFWKEMSWNPLTSETWHMPKRKRTHMRRGASGCLSRTGLCKPLVKLPQHMDVVVPELSIWATARPPACQGQDFVHTWMMYFNIWIFERQVAHRQVLQNGCETVLMPVLAWLWDPVGGRAT